MDSEKSSHLDATGVVFVGGGSVNPGSGAFFTGDIAVGRGRFASVWRCQQPGNAIKIFRSGGGSVEAFLYEVDILNYLNTQVTDVEMTSASGLVASSVTSASSVHPMASRYVTRLIDSGVMYRNDPTYAAIHCWYTMPLEGNSLKGSIAKRGKGLNVDVAHAVSRSIFEALAFIHGAGVIHADLKPANILMAYGCTIDSPLDKIRVKLADFGASARITDAKMDACGTAHYCSPETYSDAPTFTTAVDIWAAGCTVYAILTDEHLIEVDDTDENYVLDCVMDDDDEGDEMSTLTGGADRTDFDILDDANDVSTGASDDDKSTERNMMIICEKLFGRPPKETRSIFSFYNDDGEIEGVEYPLPRVEIVDLLLKRHNLGKTESPAKIAEIAAFIVSCMRYRPLDRITAADALRSSWLAAPLAGGD